MTAILMHCHTDFMQVLEQVKGNKLVFESFVSLIENVQHLDVIDQLEWYSAATQLLTSLAKNKGDSINPLDVFQARASFILHGKNPTLNAFNLGLGVVVIGLGTILLAAAVGVGIGMLMNLWATPLGFLSALIALETAPLIIASVSPAIGIATAAVSGFLFFKKSSVEKSFDVCVEAIKQNQASQHFQELEDERSDEHKAAQFI